MNRIEKSIIASFTDRAEQSLKEITESTEIPKGTIKKYLPILVEKGELEPIGEGRGRYYRYTSTSKIEQAALFKSGKLLGFLSYRDGRYGFEYDKSYRGKRLDTLSEEKNYAATLFPLFENLIPESDRRDIYVAEGKNLVEILLELDNTHGDFDFVPANKLYAYKKNYIARKS